MITITEEAVDFIRRKQNTLFLELPKLIVNCCFSLQECPTVRFGEPRDQAHYEKKVIQGTTVFVPKNISEIPLTISLSSFIGIRRLVIEGWRYC